jgi:hypothetical protein
MMYEDLFSGVKGVFGGFLASAKIEHLYYYKR